MSVQNINKKIFDALVSKNFDPQQLDSSGNPSPDPSETEVFSFEWTGPSGKDYGTVAIMLGDDSNMDVYFGDNLGKSMEEEDKKAWFDFLYQLRMMAKTNLLSFGISSIGKLKYAMQSQNKVMEGLFESWMGNKTTSWTSQPESVRLIIKHKRPLGENDARFRYISSLFLETTEGERFKLPFTKLAGGRAMLEHVKQGGRPYDIRGQHISEMVNDINVLSTFKRASAHKIFEGETANLVETATEHYVRLQKQLKGLSSPRGYKNYFEAWSPTEITREEIMIEDLKTMFVEQNLDTRIEQALPLLAKLQKESAMKEIGIFEGWVNCIAEGTWALPDTPEKQAKLVELLSQELPVGADAVNATEQLYDLIGDDHLFDQLEGLADDDANADARVIIMNRLEQLAKDPNVAQVIGKLKVKSGPQETPHDAQVNSSTEVPPSMEEDFGPMEEENIDRLTELAGLKEHGGGMGKEHWQDVSSEKKYETPWQEMSEEVIEEGSMKDMLWKLAERLERDEFIEYSTDELGMTTEEAAEFWDSINGDLEEGWAAPVLGAIGGAALGGSYGADLGAGFGGDVGADIGKAVGQEKAGWLGSKIGQSSGASAGAKYGANAGKTAGQVAGGIAGLAGGVAVDSAMQNNKKQKPGEEEVDENAIGSMIGNAIGKKLGTAAGVIGAKAAKKVGVNVGKMALARAGRSAGQAFGQEVGDVASSALAAKLRHKLHMTPPKALPAPGKQETDEGWKDQLAGASSNVTNRHREYISKLERLRDIAQRSGNQEQFTRIDNEIKRMGVREGWKDQLAGASSNVTNRHREYISKLERLRDIAQRSGNQEQFTRIDNEIKRMGVREGWKGQLAGGTVGTLAGGALGASGGPLGVAIGSALGGTGGQMLGDKLGGPEEAEPKASKSPNIKTVKEETALTGQYGHSGKMSPVVSTDNDLLARLKFLAGGK